MRQSASEEGARCAGRWTENSLVLKQFQLFVEKSAPWDYPAQLIGCLNLRTNLFRKSGNCCVWAGCRPNFSFSYLFVPFKNSFADNVHINILQSTPSSFQLLMYKPMLPLSLCLSVSVSLSLSHLPLIQTYIYIYTCRQLFQLHVVTHNCHWLAGRMGTKVRNT